MVARTLGGDRIIAKVLWPASLTYLGTASEGDPVSKQNGGTGSGQVKPILHRSYDMACLKTFNR